MVFTIDEAKKYFQRQKGDEDSGAWDDALTNALPIAEAYFQDIVGSSEYDRFLALPVDIPVSNAVQSDGYFTLTYSTLTFELFAGEKFKLSNQTFTITSSVDGVITAKGKYFATPSLIQLVTIDREVTIHAFCLLAAVTITAGELLMNTILPEQTQRGDDIAYRAYDPVKKYYDSMLNKASIVYQSIGYVIENEPEQRRLERA